MGGGGSLDAMNKSINYNRSLLKKVSLFDKKYGGHPKSGKKAQYKKMTPEFAEELATELAEEKRTSRIRLMKLIALSIVLGGIAFMGLFWFVRWYFTYKI